MLYEDDAVVVLDKPAGLLAVPVNGSDAPSALSLLVAKLQLKRQRALTVHRIDRFTSGALVFAKTGSDRHELVKQFQIQLPVSRNAKQAVGRVEPSNGWEVFFGRPIVVPHVQVWRSELPAGSSHVGRDRV